MIRLLLYAVIAYFIWKIVKVFSTQRQYRREQPPPEESASGARPDFSNIKDAEFEDLPPASPKDPNSPAG